MKQWVLCIVFITAVNFVCSQETKGDLYKTILQNNPDTNLIRALINLAAAIEDNYPDSALSFYQQSLILSKKLNYQLGISSYYKNISLLYSRKNDFARAEALGNEGIKQAALLSDKKELAAAYANLGTVYGMQNKDDLSSNYYSKAIDIFIMLRDTQSIATIYGNAGSIYANQSEYKKAVEFANKSLLYAISEKDTYSIVRAYRNLAESYSYLNEPVLEEKYTRVAFEIAQKSNNEILQMNSGSYFANWLNENSKPDSAILVIQNTYNIAVKNNYPDDIIDALSEWAWGYILKGGIKKANEKLKAAKQIVDINSVSPLTKHFYLSVLLDAQKATGNYKEALTTTEAMQQINDSLSTTLTKNGLLSLSNRLNKIEEENRLLLKEIEIKKQRNWLTLLSAGSIILLGGGVFYFFYNRKKLQIKNQQVIAMEKEQELIATKSNLEGQLLERSRISKEIHDELGSSLTSISLLTEVLKKRLDTTQNPEVNKISDTSADMVDKMNEIIWALNTSNDTITSLIAYTRKFANNFLQDAGIELQFEESLLRAQIPIEGTIRRNIYLTVKEAINNVVKHSGANKVIIKVTAAQNLIIEIKDNGKGIRLLEQPTFRNGLNNMKKRMEDIGGSIDISSNNGTLVTLSYPIKAA
jgi:signal transduction histidine kinase